MQQVEPVNDRLERQHELFPAVTDEARPSVKRADDDLEFAGDRNEDVFRIQRDEDCVFDRSIESDEGLDELSCERLKAAAVVRYQIERIQADPHNGPLLALLPIESD
jgi:hypothetical protein